MSIDARDTETTYRLDDYEAGDTIPHGAVVSRGLVRDKPGCIPAVIRDMDEFGNIAGALLIGDNGRFGFANRETQLYEKVNNKLVPVGWQLRNKGEFHVVSVPDEWSDADDAEIVEWTFNDVEIEAFRATSVDRLTVTIYDEYELGKEEIVFKFGIGGLPSLANLSLTDCSDELLAVTYERVIGLQDDLASIAKTPRVELDTDISPLVEPLAFFAAGLQDEIRHRETLNEFEIARRAREKE